MSDRLADVFPGTRRTLFLRACVLGNHEARAAWETWLAGTDDPAKAFADPRQACVRLAPLLDGVANGAGTGRLGAAVSAAVVREELRWRTIAAAAAEALSALRSAQIEPVLVGGVAAALETYSSPWQRHCHDVDLVIAPDESAVAARVLGLAGWRADPAGPSLRHTSETNASLHVSLFRSSAHSLPIAELRARAGVSSIGGERVAVAAPEHLLLRATEGAFLHARRSLAWAADAAVLARSLDEPGWSRTVADAAATGSTTAAAACVRYLADSVGLQLPDAARSMTTDESGEAACLALMPPLGRRQRLESRLREFSPLARRARR